MPSWWMIPTVLLPIAGGRGARLMPFSRRIKELFLLAVITATSVLTGLQVFRGDGSSVELFSMMDDLTLVFRLDGAGIHAAPLRIANVEAALVRRQRQRCDATEAAGDRESASVVVKQDPAPVRTIGTGSSWFAWHWQPGFTPWGIGQKHFRHPGRERLDGDRFRLPVSPEKAHALKYVFSCTLTAAVAFARVETGKHIISGKTERALRSIGNAVGTAKVIVRLVFGILRSNTNRLGFVLAHQVQQLIAFAH